MANQFDRKSSITSSEIGAVLGLDPFTTPLKLWGIKTGRIEPDDLSGNEAVEWGIRHEPLIAEKFAEKNGVKLMAYKKRFVHPVHSFLSCELDRIIVGSEIIVEIKTASHHMAKEWEAPDQIPAHYICQVMFAMGLSGRKKAWVAVLIGGNKYLQKLVEFDQEFYDDLISKAVAFKKLIDDDVQPMATADDKGSTLYTIFEKADDQIAEMNDMEDSIKFLQELKGQVAELTIQKEDIEAKILQKIGDNLGIKTETYTITAKPQITKRINTDLLKEKKPEIYAEFCKDSFSRPLRVKLNKGGKDGK